MKSERLRLASVLADTATIGYIRVQYPWLAKELEAAATRLKEDEAEMKRLINYANEQYADGYEAGHTVGYDNGYDVGYEQCKST